MLVLSIISLVVSIGALVLALICRKKCADLMSEVAANYLTISALEKQVKAQSLATIETEKKPTIPVTYDTKSNTLILSSNLLVTGFVTAGAIKEE